MFTEYVLALIALTLLVILIIVIFWSKSKTTPQKIAQEIFIEGLLALASGDEKLAYQKFRSVVGQDTENVEAYLLLGDLLRKKGKPEKALQIHKELAIRPSLSEGKRAEIEKSLADDYLATQQFDKAVEILEELWKKNRQASSIGEKLLAAYEKIENWEKAVEIEEKLSKSKGEKTSPRAALYKVLQGKAEADKEDYHRARLAYKEALNYDEKCVPAYLYLGEAYVADGRLDEGLEYWRKLLEIVPPAGYLVYPRLEKVLYDLGRFGEIMEVYQEVLEKNPQEIRAMLALANIYQKKGNTNLAVEILRGILEIQPDFFPALGSLILLYSQNGMLQEAKALVEKQQSRLPGLETKLACQNCGAVSSAPPWRCSSCGRVNVYQW